MRASRLIATLLVLQRHDGRATAATVAAELEVSVRTVYRDVAALQAAGIPLWTETGPQGGIRLLAGWRAHLADLAVEQLPTGDLSSGEAGSLFLAGAGPAAAELGFGTLLASAQSKLLSALPPELRDRAARVGERFLLDAPHWFHHPEAVEQLAVVADAVWRERRLELDYRRGDGIVTRTVDPLGLVLKAGVWYLVAAVDGDARTYRVARIVRAEPDGGRIVRPAGFDLPAWWEASAREFNAEMLRTTVRLRLAPRARRRLAQVTDAAAATAALACAAPPDAEGWQVVDLAVESDEVAADQLLSLGSDVEVLDPPAVRAAIAATGAAMARRNG